LMWPWLGFGSKRTWILCTASAYATAVTELRA
jgi:hypothetical protein